LFRHGLLNVTADQLAVDHPLAGEADRDACDQDHLAYCCTEWIDAVAHCFDVDVQECCSATQMVVLTVGDDLILHRGFDETVHELAVRPRDCSVIKPQIAGKGTQFSPLIGGDAKVCHRGIEELYVRGDVCVGVHATRKRGEIGSRRKDFDVSFPGLHAERRDVQRAGDRGTAGVRIVMAGGEQQALGRTRIGYRTVSVVERDGVVLARLSELAAGSSKRVQTNTPVDVDPCSGQFVSDHPHVELNVVTGNYSAIEAGRHVMCHVVEGGGTSQHRCIDTVDPGRADISLRLHQCLEFVMDPAIAVDRQNGDLDHPVHVVNTRRLDINDSDAAVSPD
jgi:hypothetical protein